MDPPDPATTNEVTPPQLASLLQHASVHLVDCREDDEFAICRIDGARLIPLGQLRARIDEARPPAHAPLVVYCHHGMRSLDAVATLRALGVDNSFSLRGGIDRWSLEVDPGVPRY